MIHVGRSFDRTSGHSVFVLSNCYVEQTPPLGQSDKCREKLASTSLSSLLKPPPPFPPQAPRPTSCFLWTLYLKWTQRGMAKLFQGVLVSYDWSSPILGISSLQVQAKSFPWQALSRLLKWSWTERLNFGQLELFPPLLNHWKTTCLPCLSPSHLSFIF